MRTTRWPDWSARQQPSVHVRITPDWGIDLEDGFERKVEDGDLILWQPGRTVYAAVYNTDNAEAEDAIEKMLRGRPAYPARTFDRTEGSTAGHAYLLPEGEGAKEYWGLNTWTATKGSVACVTFYFDSLQDLDWALSAWKSVRCDSCGGASGYMN